MLGLHTSGLELVVIETQITCRMNFLALVSGQLLSATNTLGRIQRVRTSIFISGKEKNHCSETTPTSSAYSFMKSLRTRTYHLVLTTLLSEKINCNQKATTERKLPKHQAKWQKRRYMKTTNKVAQTSWADTKALDSLKENESEKSKSSRTLTPSFTMASSRRDHRKTNDLMALLTACTI
jgi:hypothetical protein